MNYLKKKSPFLFLLFLAFFSCKDDTFDNYANDSANPSYKISGFCPPPDSLYVSDYDIDDPINQTYTIEYTWTEVTDADGYEFQFFVNDSIVEIVDPYPGASVSDLTTAYLSGESNTSYTVTTPALVIGDILKAQVRTVCDSDTGSHSDWLETIRGHGNGGATVDDIGFSVEAWNLVQASDCKYVRFKQGVINGCDNQPIDLRLNEADITFFKKNDVCDIIFSSNEVCTGLGEVASQILDGTLMAWVKRDFALCDPNQPSRIGCNGASGEYDDINCAYPINNYNWHSFDDSNLTFNNITATADVISSSCLGNPKSAKRNVWFMFGAPSTGNIELEIQPVGNFRNFFMAIFEWDDTDGDGNVVESELTELTDNVAAGETWSTGCEFVGTPKWTAIAAANLDTSKTYFLSVDNVSSFKGNFNLKVSDEVGIDNPQGAFDLTGDSYSNGACYTADNKGNLFTTANKNIDSDGAISCAPGGRNRNIWFQFEDPGTGEIEIEVSSATNIRYYYMTLWKWNDADNDGFVEDTELTEMPEGVSIDGTWSAGCRYMPYSHMVSTTLAVKDMETGVKYFLSMEKHGSSNVDLELCVYDNISMDYAQGAFNLTDVTPANSSWCSAIDGFSTRYATVDLDPGSCDNGSVARNVWFRMDLSNTSDIELDIDPYGTFRYYYMTLWEWNDDGDGLVESSELTEEICDYTLNAGLGNISIDDLSSGTYFLSVDNASNYKGEFQLCFDRQDSN